MALERPIPPVGASDIGPETRFPAQGGRTALAVSAVVVAVALAVLASFITTSSQAALTTSGELLSSGAANFLSNLAATLPVSYAFAAGMVSAANPCGFALLPTYLGAYLGSTEASEGRPALGLRLSRALLISGTVTVSFVVLFGVVGIVLGLASYALAAYFRWIGLGVGLLLVLGGGWLLAGHEPHWRLGQRLADRMGEPARRGGLRGYLAYGLAYGACSLGCTLPIFLTVVGSALTLNGPLAASLQFFLYALGMGFVLSVLTCSLALVKHAVQRRVRSVGRYLAPASSVLLLLAGSYVIYYWLTLGGLLDLLRRSSSIG